MPRLSRVSGVKARMDLAVRALTSPWAAWAFMAMPQSVRPEMSTWPSTTACPGVHRAVPEVTVRDVRMPSRAATMWHSPSRSGSMGTVSGFSATRMTATQPWMLIPAHLRSGRADRSRFFTFSLRINRLLAPKVIPQSSAAERICPVGMRRFPSTRKKNTLVGIHRQAASAKASPNRSTGRVLSPLMRQ